MDDIKKIIDINKPMAKYQYNFFKNDNNLNDYILDCGLFIDKKTIVPQKIYTLKNSKGIINLFFPKDNLLNIVKENEDEITIINVDFDKKVAKVISGDNYFERLDTIRKILMEIDNCELGKYMDTDTIYHYLNIRPLHEYNYVIENDDIALSLRDRKQIENVNSLDSANFDIILKDTKEHIGNISFKSSYEVAYFINENFRGKHYATNALSLLIKLLKNNKNKNIELTFIALNEFSERVIINNDGKFQETIPYMDSNKPVYSIKI